MDGLEIEYLGRIAARDTRLLTVQVLKGALSGHIEEDVNDVNAPAIAEERGIQVSQTSTAQARDFTDLVRVTVVSGGRAHSRGRHHARPPAPPAPARGLGLPLQHPARAPPGRVPLRRPARDDRPRRARSSGEAGINISAAAVGRRPDADHVGGVATMLVTTDSPVPQDVVDRIAESDGFEAGRTVSL